MESRRRVFAIRWSLSTFAACLALAAWGGDAAPEV